MQSSISSVQFLVIAVVLLVLIAGIFWIVKNHKREQEKTQARLQEIQAKLKEIENNKTS